MNVNISQVFEALKSDVLRDFRSGENTCGDNFSGHSFNRLKNKLAVNY